MSIKGSVGKGGGNAKADVTVVQAALNENLGRTPGAVCLVLDGVYGENTQREIDRYQSEVMEVDSPDGHVDPGGRMMQGMAEGFEGELNLNVLQGIMPTANEVKVALYLPYLLAKMKARETDTSLRRAHFLAQIGHESGALRYNEELASGAAYENRRDLGNSENDDGRRFKGRGLIQLTGRANYRDYGKSIGVDLTDDENRLKVARDPALAVDVACWFWQTRKLNQFADDDDVVEVTRRINGRDQRPCRPQGLPGANSLLPEHVSAPCAQGIPLEIAHALRRRGDLADGRYHRGSLAAEAE